MTGRKKKDPTRVVLSTLTGRIVAYLRVNKPVEAKKAAKQLVLELNKMGLLDARSYGSNKLVVDMRGPAELKEEDSIRPPFS